MKCGRSLGRTGGYTSNGEYHILPGRKKVSSFTSISNGEYTEKGGDHI